MALATAVLVACSKQGIEVTDSWIRKMPEGVTNTAAFFSIHNHTGESVTLTGVSIEGAGHVMMHETKVVDGMAKMAHLEEVVIEESVTFAPGGKHVMVMGLSIPEGTQSYNIQLHFANKPTLDVTAEVRNAKQ
ncbi:copper chaperone PCu(A)C [Kangiella shandongensis]|uniref:copper chaperone PCu(A)C n=1 Tax=Kangiella shandongensis TaxID=2763258 RepID=UPI001CBBC1C0|nr:copper chaperone PCu(A)C [Kangiella shandongensis]